MLLVLTEATVAPVWLVSVSSEARYIKLFLLAAAAPESCLTTGDLTELDPALRD